MTSIIECVCGNRFIVKSSEYLFSASCNECGGKFDSNLDDGHTENILKLVDCPIFNEINDCGIVKFNWSYSKLFKLKKNYESVIKCGYATRYSILIANLNLRKIEMLLFIKTISTKSNPYTRGALGALRHLVYQRDNYKCKECGKSNIETQLEIDHIIPFSKGGLTVLENLQTLCRDCNHSKHTRIWNGGQI